MGKEKNIETAKAVFERNNGVKELFFTNDGQAFYHKGPADVHQKELTGKTEGLHKVSNGNYEETAAVMTEDTVKVNAEEEATDVTDKKVSKKKEKTTE